MLAAALAGQSLPVTVRSDAAMSAAGSWTVTVALDNSLGQAVRCMVAAQPTHDFEGAPSAY